MKVKKFMKALLGITFLTLGITVVDEAKDYKVVEAAELTDVLNVGFTGMSGTTYGEWSGKKGTASDAVYAGQSAAGNDSIQLRSNNNNSGIVTTKSGGTAKSVSVQWHSKTSSGRTLDIYGKSTAYSKATDLYNSNKGTKIGSIVCGTSTELAISGEYQYLGIRSNSGALYLSEVKITWEAGGEITPVEPTLSLNESSATIYEGSTYQIEVTTNQDDVSFVSSATNIATVDENGLIRAISTGNANITVSAGELSETFAVTVEAIPDAEYIKVTSIPSNWEGEYLIVCEDTNVAFDGSLTSLDGVGNKVDVTITDGKIAYSPDLDNRDFTIESISSSEYSIKSSSGYYIGQTSNANGLASNTSTKYENTLSVDSSGNASIKVSSGPTLKYNSASDQMRFRYYKSGQKAIQLYKKVIVTEENVNVTFETNGGSKVEPKELASGSVINQEDISTSKDGYTLVGWYSDESLTSAWNFENAVYEDMTLYAKWTNDACKENVKKYNGFANLAYKYTISEETYKAGYKEVSSATEIKDGSKVVIVSNFTNAKYALTNREIMKVEDEEEKQDKKMNDATIEVENGYITSEENATTVWTANKSNSTGFTLTDGTNYLKTASDNSLTLTTDLEAASLFVVKNNNGNFYFDAITNDSEKALMYNSSNDYFRNYAISNIGSSNYPSSLSIYVKYDGQTATTTYNKVEFRLQVGVNATEMAALMSTINLEGATYGIKISGNGKEVKVYQDKLDDRVSTVKENEVNVSYHYVTVSLGDVMNNVDRAGVVFTVKVFVEYEGQVYYSDIEKTYSVEQMVKAYYDAGNTAVSGLYNYLSENGYYSVEEQA